MDWSDSFTWMSTSPASGGVPPKNMTKPKVSHHHPVFTEINDKICISQRAAAVYGFGFDVASKISLFSNEHMA